MERFAKVARGGLINRTPIKKPSPPWKHNPWQLVILDLSLIYKIQTLPDEWTKSGLFYSILPINGSGRQFVGGWTIFNFVR